MTLIHFMQPASCGSSFCKWQDYGRWVPWGEKALKIASISMMSGSAAVADSAGFRSPAVFQARLRQFPGEGFKSVVNSSGLVKVRLKNRDTVAFEGS